MEGPSLDRLGVNLDLLYLVSCLTAALASFRSVLQWSCQLHARPRSLHRAAETSLRFDGFRQDVCLPLFLELLNVGIVHRLDEMQKSIDIYFTCATPLNLVGFRPRQLPVDCVDSIRDGVGGGLNFLEMRSAFGSSTFE